MRGVVLGYRYIPEGLGCSCGPDWYTNCEEFSCASYSKFLLVTCFICPITIIIFSYSQLLGALRAVSDPGETFDPWRLAGLPGWVLGFLVG